MKCLIQRVRHASVTVGRETIGSIESGLLVLLGVTHGDTEKDALYLAEKVCSLRVFEDENGKMNLSLKDIGGELLIVSQFTLYGDCSHGRRPSFTNAASPSLAEGLYEEFVGQCRRLTEKPVQTGRFGADMQVGLCNDGPVTLILESLGAGK